MRRNSVVRIITLAATLSVLSASTVTAQLGELQPTPPPDQFKGIRTAVVTNALDDPAIGPIIEAAAFEAHRAIGGTKKGFRAETLPDARTVSNAARNLGRNEDEGNDIIVVSGGDKQTTVGSAELNFESIFIDLGQSRPCVTRDGRPDPSGTCAGGADGVPFNYSAVDFAVDEGAYLAGIVAASASRNSRVGIISGQPSCEECARYSEAFTLGARSVKPGIEIITAYLADDGVDSVLGDPSTSKIFAEAFINVHRPDVILPIARASSRGMVEAACEAGIRAIGTDIDVAAAYPDLADCVLASITKDYEQAVRESIFSFTSGSLQREWELGIRDGGVAVTEEWRKVPGLPVDLPTRYDEAKASIEAGLVETCPTRCPTRQRTEEDEPGQDEPGQDEPAAPEPTTPGISEEPGVGPDAG